MTLAVDGRTAASPLVVTPDPRVTMSQADLEAQLAFALAVRDAFTRLTDAAERIRSLRKQLAARREMLAKTPNAAGLAKRSDEVAAKLASLEDRMHNPTADVVYDILAMKGGTRLYSRLSPLVEWAGQGNGAPTQGMREVFAAQQKEAAAAERELETLVSADVAALNTLAAKLGIGFLVVP